MLSLIASMQKLSQRSLGVLSNYETEMEAHGIVYPFGFAKSNKNQIDS